jgi:CIC family chloride channel protein
MRIADLTLPDDSLVIAVRRANKEIIPHGNTKIYAEDSLEVLTCIQNEATVREALQNQCKIL